MLSHFFRKLAGGGRGPSGPTVAGFAWEFAESASEHFPDGPDLDAWEKAGLAVRVKENLQRTIDRVTLPNAVVFVKRCRANTPRSWLREIVRPPKACLEFENAVALRARGIPAVEPLAWGKPPGPWPGTSVLITREAANLEPLPDLLDRIANEPPSVRHDLARNLARFLAAMHDAGVAHPDPHPGNFLVGADGFVLIDVHAVAFGAPLSWPATRANLIPFNRYFQLRATRADRLRFWTAYVAARKTLPAGDSATRARDLERATASSNHRFWANRFGRYVSNNREFRKVRGPCTRGYAVRDLDADWLRTWMADPDAIFATGKLLKDSRSSTVAVVQVGEREIVLKRFRLKTSTAALKNLLRTSSALRSWKLGHSLRDRGLPTPRPLAAFHRYRLGVPCEGYIAFELVPDARGLPEAVAAADARTIRVWADRIGRLVRDMHDRQVCHRDLKAPNLMTSGVGEAAVPVLVDLVGVSVGGRATAVRDLARLNASFLDSDRVTRTDRLRFLRAYGRWALHGRGDWKSLWRAIEAATSAKAERNARVGRPLS